MIALSAAMVVAVRRWTEARALLDHPNERSSHSIPTPRSGGLAIVVLTSIATVYAGWPSPQVLAIPAAALVVAAAGLVDDLRTLPSGPRLLIHLAAAAFVVAAGWRLPFGPYSFPLTVLWIAGLTNAYNFMDGIDGIAGSQAVIAGLGFLAVGVIRRDSFVAILAATIVASSTGFLMQNWSPARIFMGDVGSGFLGFMFGALGVVAARNDLRAVEGVVVMVWPFLFDATFTFLRRMRNRENVFQAHRSHLYQRMVIAGASHARVTTRYAAVMALCAAGGAVTLTTGSIAISIAVALFASIVLLLMTWRAEAK